MSSWLIVLIVVLGVVALKLAYWIALTYFFEEEPLGDEVHTVTTADGWRIQLRRYCPIGGKGEPVLLCHGAFANSVNLSAPNGGSIVDTLVERGLDCWLIDFRGTRSSRPPAGKSRYKATIDGYIFQDIPAAIDHIRNETGYKQVHWVGHSLGGMVLHGFVITHGGDAIASATTLGSPPGFDGIKGFNPKVLLALIGIMPWVAEVVWRSVSPWVPVLRLPLRASPINWQNMDPQVGSHTFFNMAELLPPQAAHELAYAYANNSFPIKAGEVDIFRQFAGVDVPLFHIYGVRDRLTSVHNAEKLHAQLPNPDKRMTFLSVENGYGADYNHVDLAFGKTGREDVFLPIAEWIEAHPIGRPSRRKAPVAVFETAPKAVRTKAKAPAAVTRKTTVAARTETQGATDEASWVKALGKAASVMGDLDDDAAPASAGPRPGVKRISFGSRSADTPASAAPEEAPAPRKTMSAKSKSAPKKKAAATKASTATRNAASTKKTATAKKVSTQAKLAAKKKAAPKKKSTAAKKSTAKKKTTAAKKSTATKKSTAAKKKKSSSKKKPKE